MDQFESIIAKLLEVDGYWVRRLYKVELTRRQKQRLDRPSMPRTEIDLLAFDAAKNEVLAIEVKSFLNSPGVRLEALQEVHATPTGRHKLFTCELYQRIEKKRLLRQLRRGREGQMANANTTIRFGLAFGKIYQGRTEPVGALLKDRGWWFWSPETIRKKVQELGESKFDNDIATLTTKLLLGKQRTRRRQGDGG